MPAEQLYGSGIRLDGGLLARRRVKVRVPALATAAREATATPVVDAAVSGSPEFELTEEPKAQAAAAAPGRCEEVEVAIPATHAIGVVLRDGNLYPDTSKLLQSISAGQAAAAAAAHATATTPAAHALR